LAPAGNTNVCQTKNRTKFTHLCLQSKLCQVQLASLQCPAKGCQLLVELGAVRQRLLWGAHTQTQARQCRQAMNQPMLTICIHPLLLQVQSACNTPEKQLTCCFAACKLTTRASLERCSSGK
jgi:hypothetical protein